MPQPGYQDGNERVLWWKVAMHLDEAQLSLTNALAHSVDDPTAALAVQECLRTAQAILLDVFSAKGLLPAVANGAAAAPPPAPPPPAPPPPAPPPPAPPAPPPAASPATDADGDAAAAMEAIEAAAAAPAAVLEGSSVEPPVPTEPPRAADADAATGRAHTTFNQVVAETGRISSQDPNLQNIPIRSELGRQIRRGFVAAPGHVLIAADYSQIELRILAHLSGDPLLGAAFRDRVDVHTQTAAEVFGVPREEVTAEQRRIADDVPAAVKAEAYEAATSASADAEAAR
jgi:hypothetical protein